MSKNEEKRNRMDLTAQEGAGKVERTAGLGKGFITARNWKTVDSTDNSGVRRPEKPWKQSWGYPIRVN